MKFFGAIKRSTTGSKLKSWLNEHWLDVVIVCFLLTLKTVIHGYNFLGFPYIENDEVTYVLRGLAFARDGSFDVYTYWYDHAPAGWMLLGVWFKATGSALLFGGYLASARFLMLLISTASTVLVYILAKRLLKDRVFAMLAVLVVILSPLELYYQRRVLLDNIMSFWVLLTFVFISKRNISTGASFGSGVTLGLAIMTKINALFFAPAVLYAIWKNTSERIRLMSVVVWLSTVGSIIALFPIYALLKGELFPVNENPETGDFSSGISLIDTLIFQSSRGGNQTLPPWDANSDFYLAVSEWFAKDTFFIMFAIAGLFTLVWMARRKTRTVYASILSLTLAYFGMMLFIARGGVVLEFYFLPIYPIVVIVGLAGLMMPVYTKLITSTPIRIFYQISIVALICFNYFLYIPQNEAFARNEVRNQLKAVDWVRDNVPRDATIVTDNYATVFLNFEQGYENTDYNYKVEYDPDIRGRLVNDWRNIDYIIVTHEVLKQIKLGSTPFVKDAFDHAVLEASYVDDSTSFISIPDYISTNGDWAQVWRVKDDNEIILQDSWDNFVDDHFVEYGQIIDNNNNGISTSLMQTNAMVRAVIDGDRNSFNGIWQWTQDHMQNRLQDKLLSSTWEKDDNGIYGIGDANTTSLADMQAAYALLQAYERWGSPDDLADAKEIIADIWDQEVFLIDGQYVLSAFATNQLNAVLVNPSYLSPTYLKSFIEHDDNDWSSVVDDSYAFLGQIQNQSTGLFPNWLQPDGSGGYVSAAAQVGAVGDIYGYESFRIPFWLNQDIEIHNDNRAKVLLAPMSAFFLEEMNENGRIVAEYNLNGTPSASFEDIAPYGAAYLAIYHDGNPAINNSILDQKIVGQYDWANGEWGNDRTDIINEMWMPLIMNHIEEYRYETADYDLTIDFDTKQITLLDEFGNPLPEEDQPDAPEVEE